MSGGSSGGAAGPQDAAQQDANTSDDASPTLDAPGEGGSACLFCEDFETGAIDPNKWDTVTQGSIVEVEQQVVAHGKYAMHVHGQSGNQDWALLVTKNVPAALKGPSSFGRVYFYITPKPTSGHMQMAFAGNNGGGKGQGPGPFPKLRYMEVANIGGNWQLGFDLLDVTPLVEEVTYPPNVTVPVAAWQCLEWDFEDNPDHITFWINGTQSGVFDNTDINYSSQPGGPPKPGTPIYNGMNSNIIGGYDTFGLGFDDWHPSGAFDLYYDDFELDTQRIGCLDDQ
jgi:hypothetical protein